MKRSDFIKGISLASLGAELPWKRLQATMDELAARTTRCALIPSETEGPYPSDIASNSSLLRRDIRETKAGMQLSLKLRIIDSTSGQPIQNAWVKIWHCNKDESYPGYSNNGYPGTQNSVGQRLLRGIQITDANGEVEFITIFPGWHTGRVTHIHFRVYLNSLLMATSQLTFPESDSKVYASNALYSPQAIDPKSIAADNIFSDGYNLHAAALTPDAGTGGYSSYLRVSINGTGTSGLAQPEPETGGQFKLHQNYPNPYINETTIPFSLTDTSNVEMEIYDLAGKKVAGIKLDKLPAGEHHIPVRLNSLGIAPGTYIYQLVVTNDNGVFRQCKVMTGAK